MQLNNLAQLNDHTFDDVIDVRTPSEFAEDHLPGAINLPVLNDEEREQVGTIYVQTSKFEARRLGAALVARNAARHLMQGLAGKPADYRPLVYCWRGGQRSGAFATILQQIGWQAETVEGGYRSYRRLVQHLLYEETIAPRLVLIDGNTGCAKTKLLQHLAALGIQTIDLEDLAAHRGSLFGGLATRQPSQRLFESRLAIALTRMDPARPIVLEAEANKIGNRQIPPVLWEAMKTAPRIVLDAPLVERAAHIVRSYPDLISRQEPLLTAIERLRSYHSREQIDTWRSWALAGANEDLARSLIKTHYDPRYRKQQVSSQSHVAATVRLTRLDSQMLDVAARKIAELIGNPDFNRCSEIASLEI